MAYSSSVSAPVLLTPGSLGGQFMRLWAYKSTVDSVATICGSSYFSDGFSRGLRARDFMLISATSLTTSFVFGYVTSATTGAGATVTASATSS